MNKADVSILTANYNNGKYIEELIRSVLTSTMLPIQFIIVDDGSTDNSVEIIKSYSSQYDFIELIKLEKNQGFANALNAGLKQVRGCFVLRVDADDYVAPDRLEKQYLFMLEHTEIGVLGSNVRYFDAVSGKMLFDSHVSHSHRSIWDDFLSASCGIIHGSTLIRTSVFKKYEYNQKNVPAEDYELFSKMLKDGVKMYNLPMTLTFVRVHSNSVSNFLPYQTIQKTYSIAQQIWGIGYSKVEMRLKYLHLKYYRRFLFESHKLKKLYFISFSAILCPKKILKRSFK